MDRATHDKIHLDFDLNRVLSDEQLGRASIRRSLRMGLESLLLQARNGLTDSIVDALECLLARQGVVGKYQVEVDRKPRHVAHEEVDGCATLERKGVVDEHERRDPRQQSGSVEIDPIHGLSTRRPSRERPTHARLLPLGN